jgi:endonuclease/exonuclease/phosphatase family metal-dependent hydrolase
MKIATLNIDWAKKYKSKNHFLKVEEFLNNQEFDFLILTEAIDLNLTNFPFKYLSEQIPENIVYENVNYTEYLKGEKAFRTIIYSKFPSVKKYEVIDPKTSLAHEFETETGNIIIYATIIGTLYKKQPFAKKELENCIIDCEKIFKSNPNLIIIGDLNTSFQENEKQFTINPETTTALKTLFQNLNLFNATESIIQNIDHIILPLSLQKRLIGNKVFIEKGELSDHKGIYVEIT